MKYLIYFLGVFFVTISPTMDDIIFLFVVNTFEREHLGVMQLSACLRQQGFPVRIALPHFQTLKERLTILTKTYRTVVVGYSLPTVFAHSFIHLNQELKKNFNFISLFGGPHPTFYPQMINEEAVDIVCIGEGEYPLLEFARAIVDKTAIERIRNLWIKKRRVIYRNELRPLINDLSSLPFPDRALFREGGNGSNHHNMIVMTGRGCPFSCSYCFGKVLRNLYKNYSYYGRRPVNHVVAEIRECAMTYGIQFVSFVDSNFIADKTWLLEFSEAYRKEINVPFYCNVHPNDINDEEIALLSRSGCSVIGLGIECGDEKVRFEILKRPVKDATLLNAAKLIKRYNIKLATSNILGIPGADIKSDLLTLKMNIGCNPDYAMTYMMSLHPGTEIYNFASKNHELDESPVYYNGVHWARPKKFRSSEEKKMTVNLQNLFNLFVKIPALYPLVGFLARLPLEKLYYLIYIFFEGCATFSYKRSCKGFMKRTLIHVRILRNRLKDNEGINHYSK